MTRNKIQPKKCFECPKILDLYYDESFECIVCKKITCENCKDIHDKKEKAYSKYNEVGVGVQIR